VSVIGIAGHVPPDSIAATARVPPEMRDRLARALLDVARDERALVHDVLRTQALELPPAGYLATIERLLEEG
jgi:ABC-type phosphate/phosphonate transport system substrate-binding protein